MSKFHTVPLVFIDLSLEDQLLELRHYFNELGANLDDQPSPKGLEDDVRQVVSVFDICFKIKHLGLIEKILNAIVSILVMLPIDRSTPMVMHFIEKLNQTEEPKLWQVMLRVMWVLMDAIDSHSIVKYHVYCEIIRTAAKMNQVRDVFQGLDAMKKTLANCPMTNEDRRHLLRLVYEPLMASRATDQARAVMTEILGTYSRHQSLEALKDAKTLILTSIGDPKTFVYEPLLDIKPIQALKGDPVFDLLLIFTKGNLSEYIEFCNKNGNLISSLAREGFNHAQNLQKMKYLTFFTIAKNLNEVDFDTVQRELHLTNDNIEDFIVSAIKTGQIQARMDQKSRKIYVSRCVQRTFGQEQWAQLHTQLSIFKDAFNKICENLNVVKNEEPDNI